MERIAEGREAEVFLKLDGSVVKVWRDAAHADRAGREATALRVLADAGVPAPRLLGEVTVRGRPGLMVERVDGTDHITALRRRPLAVFKAGRSLARAHLALHACAAPDELPSLHDMLCARIDEASPSPLPPDLRAGALRLLDDLPAGDRLCHGDLHPGNLLGPWAAPVAIDWGDATRGDPLADVARTALLLRLGAPPPGALGPLQRLNGVGRRILRGSYLTAYNRSVPLDHDVLARWELVRAAARLWEPIPEEHPDALAFLRAGLATHQ